MSRERFLSALGILGCIGFLGLGLVVSASCDGGYALISFGVAVAFLGLVLLRSGAWATIIPIALVTLTLVVGGLYGGSVAGCGF